jgi:hypothetical protein
MKIVITRKNVKTIFILSEDHQNRFVTYSAEIVPLSISNSLIYFFRKVGAEIAKELLIPRSRPRLEKTKEHINIPLSPDVVKHFKSAGSGWHTRIHAALRQYIEEHTQ